MLYDFNFNTKTIPVPTYLKTNDFLIGDLRLRLPKGFVLQHLPNVDLSKVTNTLSVLILPLYTFNFVA